GFDPSRLTLEVTESTLMTEGDETLDILHRLRDVGIRIATDDFGTGYSSLAYLKRLPAKALKVDKAFVDGLGTRLEDTALVTGIIGLASALNFEIVAEGVETEVQLRELRRLGCEYSQGYLHSRPLKAEDFEAWIGGDPAQPATNGNRPREVSGALSGVFDQNQTG
ncbi:MAG: EAL domain-containing protein, partial [Acidimicrobiales bacterium]